MRVLGIDPGTVSIDICGLADGRPWLDLSIPTREALADPAGFLARLVQDGPPDLIAGPSGYGLPLVRAGEATEADLRLALLSAPDETGGLGGLGRLLRLLRDSAVPVVFTPGVIHLPTVPAHRKINRVDLGTADKVAAAALGLFDQTRRMATDPARRAPASSGSFLLLELGGAFTAALAVERGQIVDGIGGTAGPIGWRSSGGWDGEVAFLAERVGKELLFQGGAESVGGEAGVLAYVEGGYKAALALTASVPEPREILLSGRHAADPAVRDWLVPRLRAIAPVRVLEGFARVAKQGAQGAAILAEGLAGGTTADIVESLAIREATGTVLDHLRVITPEQARRRLGIS